jgi:hypothetical protein
VHQLIHGYVAGRTAETWIVLKKNKQEIEVLQAHYGGEGKKTFRTKQVESLHKTLQYKNGRAMTFEKFSEAQQVRLSFDKVQHPSLETTKSSLLVSWFPGFVYLATDENVDYNYWKQPFNGSGQPPSRICPSNGQAPSTGIRGADGKICTGFYKDFKTLSAED